MKMQEEQFLMTYCPSLSKIGRVITLKEYHHLVTTGLVRSQIEAIRQAAAQHDRTLYDSLKKKLPAVILGAEFDKTRRKTGFRRGFCQVVLDIDHLAPDPLAELLTRLRQEAIFAHFNLSPGGDGVKIFIAYRPRSGMVPTDWEGYEALHHTAYDYIVGLFNQIYPGYEIDTTGRDPMRICFLSYDPDAYYNPHAEVVEVEDEVKEEVKTKADAKDTSKPKPAAVKAKAKAVTRTENLESLLAQTRASEDRLEALFIIICKNLYSAGDRFQEGRRNDFVYKAVSELNRLGITREKTMAALERSLSKLAAIEKDISGDKNPVALLDMDEVRATVKSVYDGHTAEHNTRKIGCSLMKHIYLQVEIQRSICLRKNMLSLKIEYIRRLEKER